MRHSRKSHLFSSWFWTWYLDTHYRCHHRKLQTSFFVNWTAVVASYIQSHLPCSFNSARYLLLLTCCHQNLDDWSLFHNHLFGIWTYSYLSRHLLQMKTHETSISWGQDFFFAPSLLDLIIENSMAANLADHLISFRFHQSKCWNLYGACYKCLWVLSLIFGDFELI